MAISDIGWVADEIISEVVGWCMVAPVDVIEGLGIKARISP